MNVGIILKEKTGICKLKPQWHTTLQPVRMLLSGRQKIISVGDHVEKRELLCAIGRSVSW